MHQVACHGQKASSRRYHEYTCPLCASVQKRPRELAAHIVVSATGEARRCRETDTTTRFG